MANNFNIGLGVNITDDASKIQSEINKKAKNIKLNAEINLNYDKQILSNQIKTYMNNNTKAAKEFGTELSSIQKKIEKVDSTDLKSLRKEFTSLKSEATSLGVSGSTVFQKFRSDIGNFLTFFVGAGGVISVIHAFQDMVVNVKELDNQLVELSKVSDLSAEGLKNIADQAYKIGDAVGKTGTDTLATITSFVRAGYDLQDAMNLSKQALIMTNVSENLKDAGIAADDLVHILNGLGEGADYAKKIVDSINEVSNTQAVDFDNLVDGATRLSAVAKQASVSFDQMLGILTAGYSSLGNMEKVASGAITIFTRLQSIQMDGEESVETVAKLQETFNKATNGAVNIVDQTSGQLRSAYDILNDLDKVWSSLNKNTQEALAFAAAGTRQKSVFLSILDNWDMVKASAQSATDSLGSADKENEKYLDSISGRLEALSSKFQELSQNTINSGFIKSMVSVGTILLDITDKVGVFNIAMIALAAVIGAKTTLGMTAFQGVLERVIIKMGVGTAAAETMGMALSTAIPVAGIILGVAAISKLVDWIVVTDKELDELSETATTAYETAKSKLESVNSELEKQSGILNDLLAKDNLTYVEKGQLEELQKITKELEIQQDLAKKEVERTQKAAALAASSATKKYNLGELTTAGIGNLMSNAEITGNNSALISDQNNLAGMIAGYKEFVKLKDEAYSSKNEDDMNHFDELTGQISDSIWENVTALQDQKDKMTDYYNAIKDTPYDKMTADQKKVYDSYNQTSSAIEFIYSLLDPSKLENFNEAVEETQTSVSKTEKTVLSLSDALTALSNNEKLMSSVKDDIKDIGQISSETLNEIIKAYPRLESTVKDYLAGKITEKELISSLSEVYDTDVENYRNSIKEKMINDETFYQSVYDKLPDYLKTLANTYDIDLKNYKNTALAKAAINNKLVEELQKAWDQGNGDNIKDSDAQRLEQGILKQPKIVDLFDLSKGIDDVVANLTTDIKVPKSGSSKDKTKKSTKDEYLEAVNADIDTLKHNVTMGKITEEQYYADVEKLNIKYFKGEKKYLDEYRKYEEEVYAGRKKLEENALEERTKAIKSQFDELEHKYNSGKLTEADYQNQRWELAKKYYWKNSEYLEDWRKEVESHHKWVVESEEEANKKRVENITNTNSTIIDSFKNVMSDTLDEIDDLDEGSQEQFNKIADAIKIAKNEATYLKKEMANLDKLLKAGKITSSDYTSLMKDLNSAMDDTADTVKDLEEKMSSAFNASYEKVLDDFADALDAQTEAINKQKEAYDEIIDAQLELLNAEKKRHDYEDSIAEKTKKISDTQSRMAELQKAANSGDRTAAKELKELQDELAKAQKDLDDTQYDHKIDLEEDALNKSKENYDDLKDKELENAKSVYNTKLENLKQLYAEEEKLIAKASQYTKTEFANQITALNTQISDIITQINSAVDGKVGGVSAGTTQGIINNQAGLIGVGVTQNTTSLTGTQKAEILSILKNGTGAYYGDKSSALNKYVYSKYKTALSYGQMVSVAKTLGVPNIKTNADVTGNETNTNAILEALQKAQFNTGGVVGGTSNNYVKQLTGEDGLGLMRIGEGILKPKETSAVINIGNRAPELVDALNVIKSNALSPNNYTTNNNNNAPSLKFDKFINIEGNVTSDGADKLEKMIPKLAEQFMDEYMSKIIRY